MSEIEQLQAENITLKKELAAARIWLYIERQKNAKAMKQALEALETAWENDPDNADGYYFDAASALREALAEQQFQSTADKSKLETVPANGGLLPAQQEPVATVESVATVTSESGNPNVLMSWWHEPALPVGTKLYTSPQAQRTWVGLTDEQLDDVYFCVEGGSSAIKTWREQARAIEAKLKEKNT